MLAQTSKQIFHLCSGLKIGDLDGNKDSQDVASSRIFTF
jgi:hypothetical protein